MKMSQQVDLVDMEVEEATQRCKALRRLEPLSTAMALKCLEPSTLFFRGPIQPCRDPPGQALRTQMEEAQGINFRDLFATYPRRVAMDFQDFLI